MKPNEGKVIIIFNKFKWNGISVDLAVPVGEKIPDRSLDWLKQFSEKNLRPLVYTEQIIKDGKFQMQQQLMAYGPPAFQQDMMRSQQEGRELW
jgi:hypothetical protein